MVTWEYIIIVTKWLIIWLHFIQAQKVGWLNGKIRNSKEGKIMVVPVLISKQ